MSQQPDTTSVVVGVDGSEPSRRALAWASREARHRGAPLRIVHALPSERLLTGSGDPELRAGAQSMLDAAASDPDLVEESSAVTAAVLSGGATKALVEESRHGALLVVGSRGYGGFANLLLGSTSVVVTAHAACPVVVVPDRPDSGDAGPVVVGIDASEGCTRALEFAFPRARDRGSRLIALHAWKPPTAYGVYGAGELLKTKDGKVADEVGGRLTNALAPWQERFPEVTVEQRVVRGQAVAELVKASGEGVDVVVVGSRGRTGLAGTVLGSVSQGLLHHAAGPVVVAR